MSFYHEMQVDGQMQGILVLIASASSEGSGESAHMSRLTRAFTAHIHKLPMKIKAQTKF